MKMYWDHFTFLVTLTTNPSFSHLWSREKGHLGCLAPSENCVENDRVATMYYSPFSQQTCSNKVWLRLLLPVHSFIRFPNCSNLKVCVIIFRNLWLVMVELSLEKNPTNDPLPILVWCPKIGFFQGLKYMLSNQVFDNRSRFSDVQVKIKATWRSLSDLSTPSSLFKKLLWVRQYTFFHTTVQFIQKLFDWLKSICKQTQWTCVTSQYLSM